MRKQNLHRFTLFNDVVRSHMLSVTRSARETRFLLHDRDTVLYYGLEWGFFEGEEKAWNRLVHNQTEHDKDCNDESQWNSTLRYGLAIEMANQNHQFHRDFPATEMHVHAKAIIMASSSENGLFPGQLNHDKEPTLFDREEFRDSYFHAGFEIPYILLRSEARVKEWKPESGGGPIGAFNEKELVSGSVQTQQRTRTPPRTREGRSQSRRRDDSPIRDAAISDRPLRGYLDLRADGQTFAIERILKRQNPYGRLTDLSNIVEIPEEWLYKSPDFLDFVPPADVDELFRIKAEAPPNIRNEEKFGQAITDGLTSGCDCYVRVDDIRKGQRHQKWSDEKKVSTQIHKKYNQLWIQLSRRRTAEKSKKRMIYLRSPDYTVATICYVTSTERERRHIAQFFDRHAKVNSSYLYDDTAVVFNSWVTEVHFRFHQFRDAKMPPQSGTKVRRLESHRCKFLHRDAHLAEEVVGFRIVGDFFDRYWTCHVLQTSSTTEYSPFDGNYHQGKHWQQRKVLELILFNGILSSVTNSMNLLLGELELQPIHHTSDLSERIFSKDSFEDRNSDELLKCFQLLLILRNNIISLQGLIEQWNHRESARGRGRPRWTRSDEEKYRKSIDLNLADFESHVREIKATAARIEFLITLVSNAQDAIRSKKSLKEAENITLFTYVTAFFLPTGLAASLFSMNGIPDHSIIAYMVVTAAVALLITACVLWCFIGPYDAAWVQGNLRFLRISSSSQKLSDEYKDDMYYKGKGSQGGTWPSGRGSSLQRGMRPFRRTGHHLEFRMTEDVEGRMEMPSPLTEAFK